MSGESSSSTPISGQSGTGDATRPGSSSQHSNTTDGEDADYATLFPAIGLFNHGPLPILTRSNTLSMAGARPPPPSHQASQADDTNLDLNAVNEGLIGCPTIAPENTPATSTPIAPLSPSGQILPTIDEALERLPDLSTNVSSAASTLAEEVGQPGENNDAVVLQSSPTMISLSSTPISHHGVREHTDWQEDIEGDLDRSLARLANLARDDHEQDRSCSAEQHYTRRLDGAIERQRMRYTYLQDAKSTITTLLIQRARLRSLMEFIVAEVIHDEHEVVATVEELFHDIDRENADE